MSGDCSSDVARLKPLIERFPCEWDGKTSVLALKAANYHWKQMEWWAFYFELLCRQNLSSVLAMPGERIDRVSFDAHGKTNWDFKSKAIKSDDHRAILNDKVATDKSIAAHGMHGAILALCDVEYNDEDRSFQKWHSELKGGLSKYEVERRARTQVSRYRKTRATLREVLFVRFDAKTVARLDLWKQGRNSNGRPRPVKYMLDLESLDDLLLDRITFPG